MSAAARLGRKLQENPLARRLAAHTKRIAQRYGIEIKRYIAPEEGKFDNWMYYAILLQSACQKNLASSGSGFESRFIEYCIANHEKSRSQIFQDLFVLSLLNEKPNGYFVEFGATNGMTLSNSYLMEKSFGWSGILAEPAHIWHKALRRNRGCVIDTRCVWSVTGERLRFNETAASELSTLDQYSQRDAHSRSRELGRPYVVETVSLNDLLRQHGAPRSIDYMSIDTEGSECAILRSFDFSDYDVSIVTVEHNYATRDREDIHELMTKTGFRQVLSEYSLFDDWYVHERILSNLATPLASG